MDLSMSNNVSKQLSLFQIGQIHSSDECNLINLEGAMTIKTPKILLIAGSSAGMSFLGTRLKKWACEIHFASSCREANASVSKQRFDLVISEFRLWDGSPYPLAGLLLGSDTTLVYSYLTENGCWWLPAVKNGESVWGSLAMKPSEFIGFLDTTLKEIRSRQTANSDASAEPMFKVMGK